MRTRLAKFIAGNGYCSRRQASRLIEENRVSLNGAPANHIDHVTPNDLIVIDGVPLTLHPNRYYFIYNKPVGIDCNLNPSKPASLVHILQNKKLIAGIQLFPVGRLDKDSRGLLLITNDGELSHKLMHPDFYHEKRYRVTVDKSLQPDFKEKMEQGIELEGTVTRQCDVEIINDTQYNIILTEGRNRQIRKMSQQCGYRVVDLFRYQLQQLQLEDLPEGEFRALSQIEIDQLTRTS